MIGGLIFAGDNESEWLQKAREYAGRYAQIFFGLIQNEKRWEHFARAFSTTDTFYCALVGGQPEDIFTELRDGAVECAVGVFFEYVKAGNPFFVGAQSLAELQQLKKKLVKTGDDQSVFLPFVINPVMLPVAHAACKSDAPFWVCKTEWILQHAFSNLDIATGDVSARGGLRLIMNTGFMGSASTYQLNFQLSTSERSAKTCQLLGYSGRSAAFCLQRVGWMMAMAKNCSHSTVMAMNCSHTAM